MSYCEDYIEPFDMREYEDEEEDWECAYPNECLMPSPGHHRSECHTVEDAEAYYAEVEFINS